MPPSPVALRLAQQAIPEPPRTSRQWHPRAFQHSAFAIPHSPFAAFGCRQRPRYEMSTAAATAVVHRPFLSPSTVWTTALVLTTSPWAR